MAGNQLFGKKIRELREAKLQEDATFTLRQFAEKVGPPKAENIIKMAELLGVDADKLLALANKVDPELEKIIKEQPTALPDLLRTVRGMSAEELRKLTERARKEQKD
jgi:hypothetical protein